MPRFRAKPFEFEASQWFKVGDHPAVAMQAWGDAVEAPYVNTRQGWVRVHPGDWIVTLPDGETYPCNPDVFAAKYAPADPAAGPTKARDILEALWAEATAGVGMLHGPGALAVERWRDDDHHVAAMTRIEPDDLRAALEATGGVPR